MRSISPSASSPGRSTSPPQTQDVGTLALIPEPASQGQGGVVILPGPGHVAEQLPVIPAAGEQPYPVTLSLAGTGLRQLLLLLGKRHRAAKLSSRSLGWAQHSRARRPCTSGG